MYDDPAPIRAWQWVVTIMVIIILIVIGIVVFGGEKPQPEQYGKDYCDRIGYHLTVAELPAKCLPYYK